MTFALEDYRLAVAKGDLDRAFYSWYGPDELEPQKSRYLNLLSAMKISFGSEQILLLNAPGRTELGGNHTDHNNGRVLAAAIHLDCLAAAAPAEDLTVQINSEGFPETIRVDLTDLRPRTEEHGTPEGLIRGIAAGMTGRGYRINGFRACLHSTIPLGAGLSSSAAFEILIVSVFNHFFNNNTMPNLTMAQTAHEAETRFFGKPCGLMDQIASAFGGILHIDFSDPRKPDVQKIESDLGHSGYCLVVVDTGGSHAGLTGDYSAITREMAAVAAFFGLEKLRGLSLEKLLTALPGLRRAAGARAVLRAIHFIEENQRVKDMTLALGQDRFADFFNLVKASGDSSWRLLQNLVSSLDLTDQKIPLALALSERFLSGQGACRVHGGGFAGTIQAFVPQERLEDYRRLMERIFGRGSMISLRLRPSGGSALRPDQGRAGQ